MTVEELAALFADDRPRADGLSDNLACALLTAVPFRILDVRDWTPQRRASECAWLTELMRNGVSGDELLYGKGGDGRPAAELAAFARALACLAYQEGGVDIAGLHWCAAPHAQCASPRSVPGMPR